jgi:hypothetical protein
MDHFVSILPRDWTADRQDTWLSLPLWREIIAAAPDLQPTDHMANIDPRDGRLVDELRPHSARWTGHPSGVVFILLWRIGRLEVGAMYPEENGGTTFALTAFDHALQVRCNAIASALGARVEDMVSSGLPEDGDDGP